MLLALLAAAAAQVPAQNPAPTVTVLHEPAFCTGGLSHAFGGEPGQARKLGELPRGVMMLAVDKRVAGCSVTVLPTRDANGQHVMTPGVAPKVQPVQQPRSGRHAGPKRQR